MRDIFLRVSVYHNQEIERVTEYRNYVTYLSPFNSKGKTPEEFMPLPWEKATVIKLTEEEEANLRKAVEYTDRMHAEGRLGKIGEIITADDLTELARA